MGFYITVHIILGILAGASGWVLRLAQTSPFMVPMWVLRSPYASLSAGFASLSALAAIITTFVQWGFLWGLATIGELFVGALIAGMLPITLRVLALGAALPLCILIMGALWGFWYI